MTHRRAALSSILFALVCSVTLASVGWAQEPELTRSEIRDFLLTAEIIGSQETGTGITKPRRLTLTDGMLTHDALFQTIDEQADRQRLGRTRELMFVDAYRYNIAAYQLAELVGLGHMMPVTVERTIDGQSGSLSWWIDDVMFDEATRRKDRQWPDDMARWNAQQSRMQVFAELVHDTDRNQTNQLYTSDWDLYMIDFSRAFRIWNELQKPGDLIRIDPQLYGRLQNLTTDEVEDAVGPYLSGGELSAILKRRDLLMEHFQQLIDSRGEARVLY